MTLQSTENTQYVKLTRNALPKKGWRRPGAAAHGEGKKLLSEQDFLLLLFAAQEDEVFISCAQSTAAAR